MAVNPTTPWLIRAAPRHSTPSDAKLTPSVACFNGGVAEGTTEQSLIDAALRKGVRIRKCHTLPKTNGFHGCAAFKAFLHCEDIGNATFSDF